MSTIGNLVSCLATASLVALSMYAASGPTAALIGFGVGILFLGLVLRRKSLRSIIVELGSRGSARPTSFSGGIASLRAPSGYAKYGQADGSLVLNRMDINGATIIVSACLMEVVHPEHDPVYAIIESWVDEHGGTLDIGPDRMLARAHNVVEESGESMSTYAWLLGQTGVLTSVVLEIQTRKVRPRNVKLLIKDVERRLLKGIQTNVAHHAIASGYGPVHYPTVGTMGLPMNKLQKRDRAFLESWSDVAGTICERYFAPQLCTNITPSHLDMLMDLWRLDSEANRPSAEDLEKAMGTLLGMQCQQQLEMDWVATEIDDRRHLVICHRPSGVMFFPFKAATEALCAGDQLLGALAGATEQQIVLRTEDSAAAA